MSKFISRTGRVQSWIDNPEARLPVSCTVFLVDDSMTGPNGIEASWKFVSHALRFGAGVAVHLSNLRAKGTENGKGLTASGPVSFGKIYSTLNEVIRRGGHYKNGACVLHLDLNHPDIQEFIEAPRNELLGLNGVSILPKSGGMNHPQPQRHHYSKASAKEISGS